ncbi:serine/threonine protein kinase [Salinibacterium sp. UTAS2018]|uniref:serine/threonine-protein kinase n=1 Tax=Salinibacterium sp. UTAS2018 TaxID=2508880 RepID=UPI0010097A18|nr:serine/threonine-protein kinase [Salinibacterium sp. UTAS2018]QAV69892.1 serine/threonine protein kinase [Salinibacterium sp. UTAS2018]
MRRAPSTPPELPGYTFVKLLGSGGFSDVFLYDQHLPKRRVAVKVLLTEDLAPATRASFVAEANLMAQLSAHPYIVSIFHADVASDDRPYFVMEYCSGPSLAERYKSAALAVTDVLRVGIRVSGAVATAHGAGILHRDIKPANILTNDYGWPALTDFGISSALDDEIPLHTSSRSPQIEESGSTTGASIGMSVPWSPPEMFEDDPNPDVRADVFSLAATLYTLLAGHTPFEVRGRSNGALDLMGRIERGLITPLTRTDVPASLLAVLRKGMASRREDRFASALDLARALQRVELELGYAPTTVDVPNLAVDDVARTANDSGDEDATRARGVATIEAQPAAPTAPTASMAPIGQPASGDISAAPALGADETQLRGAPQQVAQPQEPEPVFGETVVRRKPAASSTPSSPSTVEQPNAGSGSAPPPPVSRRRRVLAWVVGGAAAAVALAVVLALAVTNPPASEEPTVAAPSAAPTSAIVESVPTPTLISASESDGTVTFTIDMAPLEEGDRVIWQRVGRDSEPVTQSDEGVIAVDGYVAGATLCADVRIVRAGIESANPLEACFPQ